MSLGHFSYLLSGEGPHRTKLASDRLESFAKLAAKRYLEEKAPLNDTIRKIASENELNANQISRVCEMANIETHRALWQKTAQKESVAFPLANAKQIVKVVKKTPLDADDPGGPMISGDCDEQTGPPIGPPSKHTHKTVDSDYNGPPKGIPESGPSMASMMGVDPSASHQGLHRDGDRKKIIIVLQKRAEERKAVCSQLLYRGAQLESLEKKAYQEFKQAVLGGQPFYNLFVGAALGGFGKLAGELFPKFQKQLIDETDGSMRSGLEKQAIHRAPDDLISDNLGNVTVINGAHPVLISLDTVTRKTGEVKNLINNLLRIDDDVKIYSQRMRELCVNIESFTDELLKTSSAASLALKGLSYPIRHPIKTLTYGMIPLAAGGGALSAYQKGQQGLRSRMLHSLPGRPSRTVSVNWNRLVGKRKSRRKKKSSHKEEHYA